MNHIVKFPDKTLDKQLDIYRIEDEITFEVWDTCGVLLGSVDLDVEEIDDVIESLKKIKEEN